MNKNLLFFTSLLLIVSISLPLSAQTILSQGDIAVIGVNANNSACSGNPQTGEDRISFVCFKPITTGTQICITDCAYISASNSWAENEGYFCMTYTGAATLAAGSIITYGATAGGITNPSPGTPFPGIFPSATMPYTATPGTWSFSTPSPPYISPSSFVNTVNMNSASAGSGDQIYFMQGGTWSNPTNGGTDATYPSSNILYGFSTSTAPGFITTTPTTTQQSNLVPGLECNVMAPAAALDFTYFVPPSPAPTSQAGWIAAINNPANWVSRISCSNYNTTFTTQYPAGTLFTGSLPSGLLTDIPDVNLCGTTPYTNYNLTQHNTAIIGSAGYASSEIYWYTSDPSQGTNASTAIIGSPSAYTFSSSPITLYAAQASSAALSTTKRCNLVAITFTINPYPTLTPVAGTLCYATTSLLNPITVNNPGGFTVAWYSSAVGGSTLSVGNSYTPSPLPTSTTTYYAEVISAGCATRVPVPVYLSTCVSNCQATDLDTIPISCFGANDGQAVVNFEPAGNPVYFTPNVSATSPLTGGHTYNWSTSPTQTANPAIGLAPGTYTVTVSGTGNIVSMPINSGDAWIMTSTAGQTGMPQTIDGPTFNTWSIGTGEGGQAVGTCASASAGADATLKISTNPGPDPKPAAYNYGANNLTSRAAISPAINLTGWSGGSGSGPKLYFEYAEVEESAPVAKGDNMTVYYSPDNSVNWFFLDDPPSTYNGSCSAKANWSSRTINLPVTANNNPNVKIAFVWQNNNNGRWASNLNTGPSFSAAVNNILIQHQCTYVPAAVTIPNVPEVTATISAADTEFCLNETAPTLSASVTPATAPSSGTYTYSWSTGATTNSITAPTNAVGTVTYTVSVTNTYVVTITAVNGSTSTATRTCTVTDDIDITIHDLPSVNLGADFIGCNNNFAGVNATLDAGAGFSYSWSNSATTQTISPTTSNTYTVTITDGNGCRSSDAIIVTINQPPNVTPADLTITNVTNCTLANGQITFPSPAGVTVETGSGFTTTGVDVTGTSPLTGLGVGSYTLVYTNNTTGCFTDVTVNVGSATALPPTPSITPNNPSICVNGTIPTFTASPNGGGGPSWQWYGPNNSSTSISGATNATYTPTAAQVDVSTSGSYDFYVTNTVLGCESLPATVTLTIQAPPAPSIVAVPSATVCSGNTVTLNADNIAGATYSWSNGGGSSSSATFTPTNGTASPTTVTYTVTVTEGVCAIPTNIAITVNPNPTAGVLTPTPSLCSLNNGQIAFTNPSGGNVYYSSGTTYNTITGVDVTGTSPVTALAAGDYTFRFENPATSCFTDVSTTITNNNTIPAPSITPINPICYTGLASSNPSISASGSPGTYQWYGPDNPATLIAGETAASYTPAVIGNVSSATTYTFYVASVVGSCESTKTSVTFTINPLPAPTINGNNVLCSGTASNTLTVNPAFNSYLWSDGSNGASISNATANNTNYAVTVTDGNSCQGATNVTVVVNSAVTTTITPATIGICNGGSVAFDAGSGFDSYTWSNSGGNSQTTTYSNITANTTYTVTVTATQNGVTCSGTANANVTVNPNPNLTAGVFQSFNICGGATVNLTAVPYTNSGANGTQFYTDFNGDPVLSPTNTPTPTTPGTYIYVLTETVAGTGCSDTLQIRVNVNATPSITLTPASTSICTGSSFDLSTLTVNDANSTIGTISYHSGTPATAVNQLASPIVSPTTNTTYYIKKTVGICSDEEPFAITVNPLPTASIGGTTAVCSGSSTTLTASGGTTYLWDNGSTNAALTVSPTTNTTYTVTVTNANNCPSSTSASVTVNTALSLSNQQTNCNIAGTQYTVSFDISGTGPFSVTGVAGTLTGSSFASNAIPVASAPTISISSTAPGACPAISYTPAPACTTPSSCTTTTGCFGANLVVDGSFETFNAGSPFANFISNYDYSPCPGTICTNSSTGQAILCQYDFSVQTSPNPCNSDFSSNLNDHTSGSGNMMIVDFPAGNVAPNNRIWCQTISLSPNTNYCFGAYFINILPTGTGLPTPLLGLNANGTLLGTVGVPETEQWTSGSYQFNSGIGGNYVLCITNENFGALGYDVAIDDIYIRPINTGTPPNATDDIASICQNQTSQVINVLTNDTAGSNPIASVNIITPPPFTDGEISAINFAAGTVTFTPFAGFSGTTSFQYQACDASGCCDIATVTITQNLLPNANISGTSTICSGQSTTLTANGGTTYLWDNASTNAALTVSPTTNTTYTVTVTNTNNCSTVTNMAVTVNNAPTAGITIAETSGTANDGTLCVGNALSLTATGGTSYQWTVPGGGTNNSNPLTTAAVTTANGGTYTVVVTDANGCTASTTTTITVNNNPTATASIIENSGTINNNAVCLGAAATITATGGGTYQWTLPNASTSAANPINIVAAAATDNGTYTVTVTNNGCTNIATVTLTVNTPPSPTISGISAICNAQSTTLTANGGTTYTWNTGGANPIIVSPTNNTTYTVTVTDSNSCTASTTTLVTVNPLPTASISGNAPICNGSNITLTASGGTTYTWNTGGANPITVSPTTNTTYTVTVSDANSCSSITTTTVTVNPLPSINLVTDCGATPFNGSGSITVTASVIGGGTLEYSSDGITFQSSNVFSGLNNGGYTITVRVISTNCSNTATANINCACTAPTLTINQPAAICQNATGNATINLTTTIATNTGTSPVYYSTQALANAGGAGDITTPTAVGSGIYYIRVNNPADATCFTVEQVDVTINPLPMATASPTDNTACSAPFNGNIDINVTSAGTHTFLWSNGDTTEDLSDENAGNYTVTITNTATNCNTTVTATIGNAPALPIASISVNEISGTANDGTLCEGSALSLTASGGNSYTWTLPNAMTNTNNPLSTASVATTNGGTYSVVVTADNGCTASTSTVITINSVPTPSISITENSGIANNNAVCLGAAATITASGGGTYQWTLPNVSTSATNPINIAAATLADNGTYTVTVTNNGCTAAATATLTVNSLPTANISGNAPICEGESITLTASGGTSYNWSGMGISNSSDNPQTLSGLGAGSYTYNITVTDANACATTTTASVTVNNNPTPIITGSATFCVGSNTTLNAGTYSSYIWDNGQTNATITVNTANSYIVTVTDSNGCTGTDVQIVNQSNSLNPIIGGISQVCPGNTTTLDATGSFSSYLWSNNNEVTPTITVGVGTYTVTVSDASGCTGTSSLNVINFVPSASASVVGSPACPGDDITLNASVGTAYSWSGPAGFSSSVQSPTIAIPSNAPANTYTYTVTVTDSNACTATATVDVIVNPIPSPSVIGDTDICSGESTTVTAAGGNSYTWNDPANTTGAILTVSPTSTITYIVTVTNAQGCSATTSTTINVTTTPTATISGNNPICLGGSINLTASGGATYSWNDPANTANATVTISPTTNTTYTVTVTSSNGQCSDTETVTTTVNSLPVAVAGGGGNVCTGSNINLTASGGNTYQWAGPNSFSSVQQNPTITAAAVIASGFYTVTVSNSNNCSSTATVSITVADCSCPNPPTISTLPTAQICSGDAANLNVTLGGGATIATWTSSGSGTFNTTTGNNAVYTPSAADIAAGNVTITIITDDPDGNGALCNTASASTTLSINALPNASISGNNSVCEGNSVVLIASGGTNYLWNDTNATNIAQLTVTPTFNTTYIVTVTSGSGCSATASHIVNLNTTPIASITGDNSICENDATTLTATGGNSYIWSGSGIVNPNNSSQTLSGFAPNTYTYTVTVTNVANCSTIINTTLTVSTNPIAGISGTNSICENGSTTLTASGNGNYTWSGATVTIPTQNPQNVSNLSNGSYPYTLTVTDSNGCTDTESITITVNNLPAPTISGSTTFCVDTQLDAGSGYDSYLWSAGNQNTQTITVSVSDTYTVTVTSNGCSSSTNITVTQANNLTPTINGNTDICAGGTTTLNTGNFETYEWTGGATTQTLVANTAGTYTVTVTDASGCTGTASTTINIVTLPNFTAGQDDLVCSYSYDLTGTGTNGSWSVASGGTATFTNPNTPTTTVSVTTCGIYELVWTEDNGACTATDTVKIGFIESVPAGSCPPEVESTCGLSAAISPASVVGTSCLPDGDCSAGSQLWQNMLDELGLTCNTLPTNCHWEWEYLDGSSTGITVTFAPDEFTPNAIVTVSIGGNYRFHWVCDTDPNCPTVACGGANADKTFYFISPLNATATANCIGGTSTDYNVVITITGGQPPYTLPDGYTETLASGTPYNYVIDDSGICPPVDVNGVQNCDPNCPTIIPTIDGVTSICQGESTTLTAEAGFVSYQWSNGLGNTDIVTITSAGTYTVIVTDNNGCTGSNNVTIAVTPPIFPTFLPILPFCSGDIAPTLPTLSVEGITGVWTPPIVNNTVGGTYTFTPNTGQCANDTTIPIIVNPLPLITTNSTCNGATADINVTIVSGNPTTFILDGTTTPPPFTGVANGNHTIVTTDTNGCSSTTDLVTNCIPGCPTITVSGNSVICAGASGVYTQIGGSSIGFWEITPPNAGNIDNTGLLNVDANFAGSITITYTDNSNPAQNCPGSIVVTVNPIPTAIISGNATICAGDNLTLDAGIHNSYQWSNGLGNGQTATVNIGGTYTITVTDNGCSSTAQVVVNSSPAITITPTITNPNCANGANGSISLQVNGGVGSYSFAWNNTLPNQQNQFGLTANTYTVTVTDDNNCTASASATITEPTNPLTISLTSVNVSCNGANNGAINTTIEFGAAPFSFVWNNGIGNIQNPADLAPNTYNVTVTDNNGCSANATITINEPSAITIDVQTTDANCGQSNGSAIATASGGTGNNYTYTWGTANGTNTNLSAGGYAVTVTDNSGCIATQAFAIGNTDGPTIDIETTTNATCGNANGSINVSASSPAGGITYQWSANTGAGNTGSVSNLAADSYTVTITDTNNCPQVATYTINDSTSPTITLNSSSNASCGNDNGEITVTVSGGTGTIDYVWSVAGNTNTINNLSAGTYTVTVTDDNNCTATLSQVITQSNAPSITNINAVGANCGNNNGSITFDAITGASYTWSPAVSNNNTANNLASGDYQVTVTANGCSTNTTVTIASLGGVNITAINATPTTCGLNNGSTVVQTNGGNNLNYNWTGGSNTNPANNLSANTYTVTVTDDTGCTATASVQVQASSSPQIIDDTITDTSCGNDNGSVIITVSNGTTPYDYDWANSPSTNNTIDNLGAGTYTVTVTDNTGCTTTAAYTINNIPSVQVTDVAVTDATCGQSNGTAIVNATGNILSYQWDTTNGNGNTADNLAAGSYAVTITDSNSCSIVQAVDISNLGAPTITVNTSTDATCGNNNGSISISANGGTGNLSYTWSTPNGINTTANNLAAGTYTVTVSDDSNCEAVQSIVIDATAAPNIVIDDLTDAACGNNNGSITILVNGGTGNLSYTWNTPNGNNTNANNLSAGTYTVTVSDDNLCTSTLEIAVNGSNAADVNILGTDVICEGGNTTLEADAGFDTYSWSNGFNTATITINTSDTYTLTVTDANGCTATDNITVTVTPLPTPNIAGNTNICENETATIDAGTGFDSYLWSSNGATTQTIDVGAGTYTVTVTDNGCSATDQISITATTLPTNVSATHDCSNTTTATVTVTATGNNLQYAIDNGAFQASNIFNAVANGAHTITVQVVGTTCSVTTAISFNCACANPPTLEVHDLSVCEGATTDLSNAIDNNTGGTPTYYDNATDANNGAATGVVADPTAVGSGTYFIRVVDAVNPLCFTVEAVAVTETQVSSPNISGLNNPYCIGETPDDLTATLLNGATIVWYSDAALTTEVGNTNTFTPPTSNTASTVSYWAVQSLNGCDSQPIQIDVVFEDCTAPCSLTDPIAVTTDLSVCEGVTNTAEFSVSHNNSEATVHWYDAAGNEVATGNTFVPTAIGTYTAQVLSNTDPTCISNSLTASLSEIDNNLVVNAGPDATICLGDNLSLSGTSTGSESTTWSSDSGTFSNTNNLISTYTPSGAGSFDIVLSAENACATDSDTLTVTVNPTVTITVTGNTNILQGQSTQLTATGADSYVWGNSATLSCDDCPNPVATPTETTTYTVASADACSETVEITVIVTEGQPTLVIPTAFSPNNDDVNDAFNVVPKNGVVENYYITIWNRWGNCIYESSNINEGWDGKYKGIDQELDVYAYTIKYNFVGEQQKFHSGNVTLVR